VFCEGCPLAIFSRIFLPDSNATVSSAANENARVDPHFTAAILRSANSRTAVCALESSSLRVGWLPLCWLRTLSVCSPVFARVLHSNGTRTHRLPPSPRTPKMSAIIHSANPSALAAKKPSGLVSTRATKQRSSRVTRSRVVSAAGSDGDARVADVKRAVVATLASAAVALPAVRPACLRYPRLVPVAPPRTSFPRRTMVVDECSNETRFRSDAASPSDAAHPPFVGRRARRRGCPLPGR
jgi:hypothetical protein